MHVNRNFAHEEIDAKISYVVEIAQAHQDLLCVRIIRPVCAGFWGGGAVKMHILFAEISSFKVSSFNHGTQF